MWPLMHDIGKIGIPDSILNKTGALTPEEQAIIRTHPVKGGGNSPGLYRPQGHSRRCPTTMSATTARGYCAGLAGEEIP